MHTYLPWNDKLELWLYDIENVVSRFMLNFLQIFSSIVTYSGTISTDVHNYL